MASVGHESGPSYKNCFSVKILVTLEGAQATSADVSYPTSVFHVDFSGSTVTLKNQRVCSAQLKSFEFDTANVRVSAPDQAGCVPSVPGTLMWEYCTHPPRIKKVVVVTTMRAHFVTQGTDVSLGVSHNETDFA